MIEIELPDGSIAEFPDGMPQAEIESVLRAQFGGQPASSPTPTMQPSGAEKPQDAPVDLSGISSNAARYLQGARSDRPLSERLQRFQANIAKGMPEQAALEQSAFGFDSSGEAIAQLGRGIAGAPEAALTVGTGAVAEPIAGLAGLGASLTPGMKEGAGARAVESVRQGLTFQPRSEAGKGAVQELGEVMRPLAEAAQVPGQKAFEAGAPPAVAAGIDTALVAIPEILGLKFTPAIARNITNSISSSEMPSLRQAQIGLNPKNTRQSVGASKTPDELVRETTAANFEIPFEGESALTKGQVTRNFEQLQFEKETAKRGDVGAPFRERAENQTAVLIQNFDALADKSGPIRSELRDLGLAVDDALVRRNEQYKQRVNRLYDQARDAGELRSTVSSRGVLEVMDALDDFEGLADNAPAIRRQAIKRGILSETDDGLVANDVSLEEMERFRQFVNKSTDITDPREAIVRRIAISAIDDITENAGGDIYKEARKLRSKQAQEFENVGLTKRLLSNKKGTTERQIAYEDVFKKVFLDSPIEEVNKVRSTLLKSGPEGKQAWADLKAKGISYIKENAQSFSQTDSRGQPIISPDKLNRVVASLDEGGKLQAIYGKRSAQAIRDLADFSRVLTTAPPGAVNFSNTASALQVALDSLGTFAVTGVPAPVVSVLREASKYIKNAKLKKQVNESLNYLSNKEAGESK